VNGLAPAPVTFDVMTTPLTSGDAARSTVRLSFDVVRSELAYRIRVEGVDADHGLGAYLHRGGEGSSGPILHRVLAAGRLTGEGVVDLTPRDVSDLEEGRMYIQIYTRERPSGSVRGQVVPPVR